MPTHTDSHIIEYHDDGTWTETTVEHGRPATKQEKAVAWTLLGSVMLAPLVPIFVIASTEKMLEWRDKRREAKKNKTD